MWERLLPVQLGGLISDGLNGAAKTLASGNAEEIQKTKPKRERTYHEVARTFLELEEKRRGIPEIYGETRESYGSFATWLGSEFIRHFALYPSDLRLGVAIDLAKIVKCLDCKESDGVESILIFHTLRCLRGGEGSDESGSIVAMFFEKLRARDFLRRHEAMGDETANPLDYFQASKPQNDARGTGALRGTIVRRELPQIPPQNVRMMTARPALPAAILQAS